MNLSPVVVPQSTNGFYNTSKNCHYSKINTHTKIKTLFSSSLIRIRNNTEYVLYNSETQRHNNDSVLVCRAHRVTTQTAKPEYPLFKAKIKTLFKGEINFSSFINKRFLDEKINETFIYTLCHSIFMFDRLGRGAKIPNLNNVGKYYILWAVKAAFRAVVVDGINSG